MGWKGTARSINSTLRQMEREAQRRQRELARREKEIAKAEELERAAYDVDVYNNRVELLLSVHKEQSALIDWQAVASAKAPSAPIPKRTNEEAARNELESYEPGLLDRLLGREARRRERLAEALESAKERDSQLAIAEENDHKRRLSAWEADRALARRVLRGEPEAQKEALNRADPFADISELGSSVTFDLAVGGIPEATLHVHGEKAVPRQTKTLLKSGKLSVKETPRSKFLDLYQDYVCSCVLRVANELLGVLPVDSVIVTALDQLLNTSTGHIEEQPILSVAVPRATMEKLSLESIDPSDSMENFVHRMDFKKTKGFAAVPALSHSDFAHLQATRQEDKVRRREP